METIFYLLIAFFLFVEILLLAAAQRVHKAQLKYGVKYKEWSTNYKLYAYVGTFYFFFCFVGLMSSQWYGFVAIIILALIPKKWLAWRIIDGLLSIAILLFILLNKYHFHIDITSLITKHLFV